MHEKLRVQNKNFQCSEINCFTQFHNENCPNGLLYFCQNNKTLSVSHLQPYLNYDSQWPMRKVKLHYTPHYAAYDLEQKVLCVCGSREEKIEMLPKVTQKIKKKNTHSGSGRFS